jgi:hypothetical protein
MATKKKTTAIETHQTIEDATSAFLASGGEIQQIPSGVSGQQSLKRSKHIVIGKK